MVETKKKPRQKQKQRQKQSQTQIVNVTVGEQKSTRKRAPRKPKGPGGGGGGAPPYQRPPVVFFEPQSFPRGTTTVQQAQNPPPAPPGAGAIARNPVVGSALIPETRQQLDAEVLAVEAPLPRRGVGGRGPPFFGRGGQLVGRIRERDEEPTAVSAVSMTSSSSSAMTRNRPYSSGRVVPSAAVEEVAAAPSDEVEEVVEVVEPTMNAPIKSYEEKPVSAGSVMQQFQFVKPIKMKMDTFGSMDSNVMRALASAASGEAASSTGIMDADQGTPYEPEPEPEPAPAAAAGAADWAPPELPTLDPEQTGSRASASGAVYSRLRRLYYEHYNELSDQRVREIRELFKSGGGDSSPLYNLLKTWSNRPAQKKLLNEK